MKKSIYKIDNKRRWSSKLALCINLIKLPKISCFAALIKYSNGTFSYILAAHKLKPGSLLFSTYNPPRFAHTYKIGCNLIIRYLSYKHIFFNLEINSLKGGQYAKAAGTFCKIIELDFDTNISKIQLPTGDIKSVFMFCFATLGKASNINHSLEFFSKAGYFRNLGIRPSVRGVAMNPVDHPHGGRTKTNSPEVTPWGKIAKKNR